LTCIVLVGCSDEGNVVVPAVQEMQSPDAFAFVVSVGDSIAAARDADAAYPNHMVMPDILDNRAKRGALLTEKISGLFADNLNLSPNANAVIIQGGVNDLRLWDEVSPNYGAQLLLMQQSIEAMTSEAFSRALQVMFVNVTPWQGDDAKWSPLKQQLTEDYNVWLVSYAMQTGSTLVDAYSILLDKSGATKGIDSSLGGALHPNMAGAIAIARDADEKIGLLRNESGPL
jgi:lysophospholipase L1-like esterase